ncbi:MAG: FkbM family methyltransferase [Bdellovibrio sp.]|nr:FkbM family methyltransferase [Bdellovibrio sp.]
MTMQKLKNIIRYIAPKVLWDGARLVRIRTNNILFKARWVKHTYEGYELSVYISDPIAKEWYDKSDWKNQPEYSLLKKHQLKSGSTIFDLGAHQGVIACILGNIIGNNGQIIAVEANPKNVEIAKKNINANKLAEVIFPIHAAVAAHNGFLFFNENFNGQVCNNGNRLGKTQVPAIAIDSLTEKYGRPDIVVIDIEGYECSALNGATQTLKFLPDFFIEVHSHQELSKYGGSVSQLLNFFPDDKFEILLWNYDKSSGFVQKKDFNLNTKKPFSLLALARYN